MLQRLLIRDFVIVESLELEFTRGFSAFTGETGAGKSILLDALGLALGARLAGDVIRSSANKAEVATVFDIDQNILAKQWLLEHEYALDDDLLLRRIIEPNGRTKAYINGRAATVGDLRSLADLLINVHGQHDNMRLATSDAQREAIDRYAQATSVVQATSAAFQSLKQAERDLHAALEGREQADITRELIDRQLAEIKETSFVESTWTDELSEHTRLSHSQELLGAARSALAVLNGEGADQAADHFESAATSRRGRVAAASNVLELIVQVQRTLSDAARHDIQLAALAKALETASVVAQEVSHDLARYLDKLDLDPALFEALDSKVAKVHALARKLRIPPNELARHAAALQHKRAQLPSSERIEALELQVQAALATYNLSASKLTDIRKPACVKVGKLVRERLAQLAMPNAQFEVRMVAATQPTLHGAETIEFAVSMNPGSALGPMAQIASGGELSRIGLALQVELGAATGLPVMVFDEVDTGVSGRVAQTVGQLLREVSSQDAQVLAVTHLPQVAASANTQYRVSKMTVGNTTAAHVERLSDEARIEELARMLSGAEVTPAARAAAVVLVEAALTDAANTATRPAKVSKSKAAK